VRFADGNTNRCPNPGIPVNGYVVSDSEGYNVGSAVEFACDPGYAMVGERRQECLFFLQWSGGGAPKCIGTSSFHNFLHYNFNL